MLSLISAWTNRHVNPVQLWLHWSDLTEMAHSVTNFMEHVIVVSQKASEQKQWFPICWQVCKRFHLNDLFKKKKLKIEY